MAKDVESGVAMNKLKVCIAGATGWAGSALSRGIFETVDLELVAAVSRRTAGRIVEITVGPNADGSGSRTVSEKPSPGGDVP